MQIKIYADGATLDEIEALNEDPRISGYTFNPSLLRKSGVTNFEKFAKEVLSMTSLPVSLEVFSDTWEEMEREALILSSWGENVFVKIPPATTEGIKTFGLVESLIAKSVKLNLTAIFTFKQIDDAIKLLGDTPNIISIFAGRISDSGRNPETFINYASLNKKPQQQILWASTRGLFNIKQADIITIGVDILKKMQLWGKDLNVYSLETVRMFRKDALDSGFEIK
jgi:transaldolase